MAEAATRLDERPDEKGPDYEIVQYWLSELDRARKAFKEYNSRCDKIYKRYRDERDSTKQGVRKFNILWSNIQTMKPAVYAKLPKPIIERRFLERNDVERTAGVILERASTVEMETSNLDDILGGQQGAVLDYLLCSRAQVWVRYEAELDKRDPSSVEDGDDEEDDEVEQSETSLPEVTSEHITVDFVNRADYLHDPARTWEEVRWNAKRSWLTRQQARRKFKELAKLVEYKDMNADNEDRDGKDRRPVEMRGEFWEIWDKVRRVVWVISPSVTDRYMSKEDDPLKLKDFWPCPKPLYGTMTPDTLVPVPFYTEYQDQADELDELSERIARLTQAIKATGVYDASQPEIARLFQTSTDNKLVPSENWAAYKDKGGTNGAFDLLDIEMMAKTLEILEQEFDRKKERLYELTGIADIIRGNSDPEETYGAQKIKGQFATLRLKAMQRDVANFARDILRLIVELIAEHFSPETLAAMTGMADQTMAQQGVPGQPGQPMPPPTESQVLQQKQAALFQPAYQLIKDSRLRTFRIDIENDSTIELDIEQEKESATQLLEGIGKFMTGVLPVGEKIPQLMPLFGQMLLWGVRKFRSGRQLEAELEQTVDKLEGLAQQAAANPPPDPEMAKVQQQKEEAQQKMQIEQSTQQHEQQMEQMRFQFERLQHQDDIELEQKKFEFQMKLELMKHHGEMAMREKEIEHNANIENAKMMHASGENDKKLANDNAQKAADRDHAVSLEQSKQTHASLENSLSRSQADDHKNRDHKNAKEIAESKGKPAKEKGKKEAEDKLAPALQQLSAALSAPVEIVRGPDGKALGARRKMHS